jgi:hypothetical protein
MRPRTLLAVLAAYALAMALVEAALVVHLRHLYYAEDPLALFPLRLLEAHDLALELARELATVVMILAVAALAVRHWPQRFAAFAFVFGLWDLGYYAWLKLWLDWPRHWLEWDVLFLIPWPWFGPWLAPALIALLFVLWGGWVLMRAQDFRWRWPPLLVFAAGTGLTLAAFLAPAVPLLAGGTAAFRGWTPGAFPWGPYLAGWALMAGGLGLVLKK